MATGGPGGHTADQSGDGGHIAVIGIDHQSVVTINAQKLVASTDELLFGGVADSDIVKVSQVISRFEEVYPDTLATVIDMANGINNDNNNQVKKVLKIIKDKMIQNTEGEDRAILTNKLMDPKEKLEMAVLNVDISLLNELKTKNIDQDTILTAMEKAENSGNREVIRAVDKLLKNERRNIRERLSLEEKKQIDQLLHDAQSRRDVAELKELIRRGASPNSLSDSGFLPLWLAVCPHKDPEIAKILIEGGADVDGVNKTKNYIDWPILSMAARQGATSIVRMILERSTASINRRALFLGYPSRRLIRITPLSVESNDEIKAMLREAGATLEGTEENV